MQNQKFRKIVKTAATTFFLLGSVATLPALAQPDTGGADYEAIATTATAAVTSVGGLAMVAFGVSITPFIARIAMLCISKAFQAV